MKARLTALVAALRRAGMSVSVAESIDAARAAAAVGVAERAALRDALGAALVKDERDRRLFEAAFAATFPRTPDSVDRARRERNRRVGQRGEGGAAGESGRAYGARDESDGSSKTERADAPVGTGRPRSLSRGRAPGAESPPDRERRERQKVAEDGSEERDAGRAAARAGEETRAAAEADAHVHAPRALGAGVVPVEPADRGRPARELAALPFRTMGPRDVEDAQELMLVLARRFSGRLRRRLAPRPRGRLDFRRTIRAAIPHGGVAAERRFRGRRRGKGTLVALCDLSASTATATDFFLALLAPATRHFRAVRLFGYVDRPVEIEFVAGQVRPAAPIDLMARSDFGRVLLEFMAGPGADLTAESVLLVLGDARNNRRPPRADLLAVARARVRRLLWLNPDPRERWNSGDSVIAAYARHADAVVACGSLAELDRALAIVARL
jgi:hypothetical protein